MKNRKNILKIGSVLLLATILITSTVSVANTRDITTPASDVETKEIWLGYPTEPQNTNAETWLYYDDGSKETSVGTSYPPLFIAIRLTPMELATYDGYRFVKTSWYQVVTNTSISNHTYDAKIWEGNATEPITLLVNDTNLTADGEGWKEHTLSTPVIIDGTKDYWIVIKCYAYDTTHYYDLPMAWDTNATSNKPQKSKWYHHSHDHPETDFEELPLNGAWLLRVAVGEPIEITINGGFGVSAIITNTGPTTLTDIPWSFTLNGSLIFFGQTKSGTIETLAAGESITVRDFLIIGLGKTGIAVKAGDAEEEASGFILLVFVVGVT